MKIGTIIELSEKIALKAKEMEDKVHEAVIAAADIVEEMRAFALPLLNEVLATEMELPKGLNEGIAEFAGVQTNLRIERRLEVYDYIQKNCKRKIQTMWQSAGLVVQFE